MDVSADLWLLQHNIRRLRERGHDCRRVLVPQLVRPVALATGLMFFNRFSGGLAFNFYAVNIYSVVFGQINPHLVAVMTAAVQLAASSVSGLLADKMGRRPLLISSGLIMSLALAGFGVYTFLCQTSGVTGDGGNIQLLAGSGGLNKKNNDWLPLLLILVFETAASVGIQPLSWLLVSELFPLDYRAAGSALTTTISYTFAFAGVKTFVDLKAAFSLSGTFLIYAAICAFGCLFAVLCVPETRQMPLPEMRPTAATADESDSLSGEEQQRHQQV